MRTLQLQTCFSGHCGKCAQDIIYLYRIYIYIGFISVYNITVPLNKTTNLLTQMSFYLNKLVKIRQRILPITPFCTATDTTDK